MLNAPGPTDRMSSLMRSCTAGGTGELGSIGLALSETLAEKYQGSPWPPPGCCALIQVTLPRGPYSKPVIWNSAHRRLKSTGAFVPLPRVAIAGMFASGTSGSPIWALNAPAKFAAVR